MPDPRPRRFVKGPYSLAIDAINANEQLAPEEKRDRIRKIRGRAFDELGWVGTKTLDLVDGYSITIRAINYDPPSGVFEITDASASRNGVPIDLVTPRLVSLDRPRLTPPLPFRYVNPPLMAYKGMKRVQGVDVEEFEEDIPAVLKEIVLDTLRMFG